MLLIFIGSLVAFHLSLVWPRNLSKRGWKVVDYIWVSVALLGLFAAVATSRKTSAEALKYWANGRVEAEQSFLRSALKSGAHCRTFVRSEYSPPEPEYSRLLKGANEQCEWFKRANEKLSDSITAKNAIRPDILNVPPPRFGDDFPITHFEQALGRYNEAVVDFNRLNESTQNTPSETGLAIFGPLLFAIAIALRLAKVTGELLQKK